jgi:thiamine pyrophosphate-dependent acetolactate synthase large subunit-like protein
VRKNFAQYQGKMERTGHYTGAYLGDPEIDFVKLAEAQGVSGERATNPGELESALERGLAATRDGKPYIIDARVRGLYQGGDSTWHRKFSLAQTRTRAI